MKQKNVFSIMIAAGILAVSTMSCHVDDTNDAPSTMETTTTATDHTDMTDHSSMMQDTTAMMSTDTMMNSSTTGPDKMMNAVKPNPAKKGMKGKVAVTEPAKSSSGKMEADKAGVYSNVEIIPSFPGGYKGLQKFFDDNLHYPERATNDGIEGTVNVNFIVDENGKLTAAKAVGDNMGYGLETEALRVVNKMPTWNPGKLKGKNVKTSFTLPVRFELY